MLRHHLSGKDLISQRTILNEAWKRTPDSLDLRDSRDVLLFEPRSRQVDKSFTEVVAPPSPPFPRAERFALFACSSLNMNGKKKPPRFHVT
ncbi:hypothetical protein RSOLAG1IB_11534 [Rhizoctonia solani AG-1 IB]|uniref:Uncharacterized protein n=1 Tax=Thanatephorus cucumeris (strain AG1-IB / isolate 7/3/14) TaxID=1108050 RepID=A0A0B7FCR0_THACB|nr:hypothetical protein RSOLAG1IB_11534 [Rhizoctonia solani AG-1 IB]